MQVNRVIIHELYKPQNATGAKLSKSLSLMDNTNEDVIRLVHELNRRYRKRNERHGVFDKSQPSVFHEYYEAYHNASSDDNFIQFSHKSAENLKEKIEGIGPAKGGYLVYAQYDDYREYCSVFFVRDTLSIAFKRNKTVNNFDLDKVQHIDFEKLAMACRINVQLFKTDNTKYLSFINTKSDDLSQYFVRWISTCDTVTSEEDTNLLLKALRKIPIKPVEDSSLTQTREQIIKNAHRIITASPTKTANVREISKNLFDDDDYLADYLHQNYPTVPNEFKTYSTSLRNFVKIYARADDVELNFEPSAYKKGVVKFDENDNSQIIIKSQSLADQIRESILE